MTNYDVWTKAKLRLKLAKLDRDISRLGVESSAQFWAIVYHLIHYPSFYTANAEMLKKFEFLDSQRKSVRIALKKYRGIV